MARALVPRGALSPPCPRTAPRASFAGGTEDLPKGGRLTAGAGYVKMTSSVREFFRRGTEGK